MATNKEATLKKINKEFQKLSHLTFEQFEILNQILEQKKPSISSEILKTIDKNEKNINKLDLKLDEHIIKAIVLFNPVASELRHLFALYRIVQNMERIADRIIKIIHLKQKINDVEIYAQVAPKLNYIAKEITLTVFNSVDSFKLSNHEMAFTILKNEIVFEDLNRDLLNTAVKEIENKVNTQTLLMSMTDLRSIISSLDRIGDHAKNIAEASIYAIKGKNYMHQDIDED